MKLIIKIILLVITNIMTLKSDEILITIQRESCFTCKSQLLDEVIKTVKIYQPKTPFHLVITDITKKQVNYYKKQIDSTFSNVDIIYDTTKLYKKKYNVVEAIEYIINKNNNIVKFVDPNKFLQTFYEKNNNYDTINSVDLNINHLPNSNITNIKFKSFDSIKLEQDFDFLTFTNTFSSNGKILFYDDITNKIGIIKISSNYETKSLSLDDYVINNLKLIDSISYFSRFTNSTKLIRFHSFLNKKDKEDFIVFSILDTFEVVKNTRLDFIKPIYKYFILSFNQNGFKKIEEFFLPSGYTIFGKQQIGYKDGYYYINVFDSKYQHRKHNEIKDTTYLILITDNKQVVSKKSFKDIEELSNINYSVFFNQNIYQNDANLYFVGIENNVFLEVKNNIFNKIMYNKDGIIKSIFDSNNIENKNIYLEGTPHKNKTGFVLMNVFKHNDENYFLFRNHNIKENINNYNLEIYNIKDELIYSYELYLNINLQNISFQVINFKMYLIIYSENSIYIGELLKFGK